MATPLHHLIIVDATSSDAILLSRIYDSLYSLSADLIDHLFTSPEYDSDLTEKITQLINDQNIEALQADYPEGVQPSPPEAEDYLKPIFQLMETMGYKAYCSQPIDQTDGLAEYMDEEVAAV